MDGGMDGGRWAAAFEGPATTTQTLRDDGTTGEWDVGWMDGGRLSPDEKTGCVRLGTLLKLLGSGNPAVESRHEKVTRSKIQNCETGEGRGEGDGGSPLLFWGIGREFVRRSVVCLGNPSSELQDGMTLHEWDEPAGPPQCIRRASQQWRRRGVDIESSRTEVEMPHTAQAHTGTGTGTDMHRGVGAAAAAAGCRCRGPRCDRRRGRPGSSPAASIPGGRCTRSWTWKQDRPGPRPDGSPAAASPQPRLGSRWLPSLPRLGGWCPGGPKRVLPAPVFGCWCHMYAGPRPGNCAPRIFCPCVCCQSSVGEPVAGQSSSLLRPSREASRLKRPSGSGEAVLSTTTNWQRRFASQRRRPQRTVQSAAEKKPPRPTRDHSHRIAGRTQQHTQTPSPPPRGILAFCPAAGGRKGGSTSQNSC